MTEITLSRSETEEKPPSASRSNFIRFLGYVRPYKYFVAAGAIGGMVKFGVPLLMPQLTRHLVDNVYLNDALTADQKTQELLALVGGMMLLFLFFWAPWTFVRHYFASKAGQKSIFDLRCDLYYHILRMSAAFFDRNKSGSIVSRLMGDVALAQNLVGNALTNIWMDMISLILILYFLFTTDVKVTLVTLVTFPLYLYFFRRLSRQIKDTTHQVQEETAVMSGNVQERIVGSRIIHAFTQEKAEQNQFLRESEQLLSITMRNVYLQSLNMTITGVLVNIAPLIVVLYGGYRVITNTLTVGELVSITMYLGPLYLPLQRFSELNVVFANSMAALDRVFEIIDEKPEIRSPANAIKVDKIEGLIEFDHAHFAYTNLDAPGAILHDIDLTVNPGEKVALVGPSGAGKSTLVSLIPRFYDVETGCVKIDGLDVREMDLHSLRKHVGMVLQDPVLFSGTVLDNIKYGKPGATDGEVIAACKAANALDFITRLPKGFHSEVGESGVFLSGGQKQRLTIARAFLKDPKILILDEATSALDSQSEKLIQSALERLMVGRTTLIIAHRLSTIENADRIVVMESGRIVETGTHGQLLENDGLYQRLYS